MFACTLQSASKMDSAKGLFVSVHLHVKLRKSGMSKKDA
jgi:hypothetical protein